MPAVSLEAALTSEAQVDSRLGRVLGMATSIVGEGSATAGRRRPPGRLLINEASFGISPLAKEPEEK